ncbi:hypothetical protein [Nitrosococcus halophilus]|uniref:hypothetical protein n=1 Tax=Nitrosococcus halophilus TaxID=133539 RepID=UPI001EF11883|nr:hypothetical protein [Nitrosococcus halophilus]
MANLEARLPWRTPWGPPPEVPIRSRRIGEARLPWRAPYKGHPSEVPIRSRRIGGFADHPGFACRLWHWS